MSALKQKMIERYPQPVATSMPSIPTNIVLNFSGNIMLKSFVLALLFFVLSNPKFMNFVMFKLNGISMSTYNMISSVLFFILAYMVVNN